MKDEEMITKQKIFRERNLRIRIPTVLISAERFKSLELNYKHTRKGKGRKGRVSSNQFSFVRLHEFDNKSNDEIRITLNAFSTIMISSFNHSDPSVLKSSVYFYVCLSF